MPGCTHWPRSTGYSTDIPTSWTGTATASPGVTGLGLAGPSAPHRDQKASPSSPYHQPHRTAQLRAELCGRSRRKAQTVRGKVHIAPTPLRSMSTTPPTSSWTIVPRCHRCPVAQSSGIVLKTQRETSPLPIDVITQVKAAAITSAGAWAGNSSMADGQMSQTRATSKPWRVVIRNGPSSKRARSTDSTCSRACSKGTPAWWAQAR